MKLAVKMVKHNHTLIALWQCKNCKFFIRQEKEKRITIANPITPPIVFCMSI